VSDEPYVVVHKGEVILSKEAVEALGLAVLKRINESPTETGEES
jgi:hypothetical protein